MEHEEEEGLSERKIGKKSSKLIYIRNS